MVPNEKCSTMFIWPRNSGDERLSIPELLSLSEPSKILYLILGELWDDLGLDTFLPIPHAGRSFVKVYSDRNSTMLFL